MLPRQQAVHSCQQHTAARLDSRQYSGVFSVLGIAGLDGQDGRAYPRLEIRELEKRKTQWNLFILGLLRFQNASQGDTLSYFQIAGRFESYLRFQFLENWSNMTGLKIRVIA